MSAEQHFGMVELAQLLVVDGDESHLAKPLTLHAVVNDIAKTVELAARRQLFLGFLNGCGNAEAESTSVVNLYFQHDEIIVVTARMRVLLC